jgi:hypothetical protein
MPFGNRKSNTGEIHVLGADVPFPIAAAIADGNPSDESNRGMR